MNTQPIIEPGTRVHRAHISDERHQVLFVRKNVVLLNENGYAYTHSIKSFWRDYRLVGDEG